jgi:hypothetical protein
VHLDARQWGAEGEFENEREWVTGGPEDGDGMQAISPGGRLSRGDCRTLQNAASRSTGHNIQMSRKELYKFKSLFKFIQKTCIVFSTVIL